MSLIRKFSLIDEINTRELELTANSNIPVELKDSSGNAIDLQVTASENLKVSLEELANGISVNSNSQLKTTPYGSTGIEARQDRSTGAMACIDYEHLEIHAGDHYFIKDWSDIAGSATVDFLVVTPNTTKWAHMVIEFSFEAEANITVYEGATTSANGTAITINNRQRNSVNTAGVTAFTGPTVITTGTSIARYKAGAGKSAGGEVRAAAELILKQDTKYLIRVVNDTVTTNWCDYIADWYEHTNN